MKKARCFLVVVGASLAAGTALTLLSGAAPRQSVPDQRLARILAVTKVYCQRLEKAALDFVCIEDIKEEIFNLPQIEPDVILPGGQTTSWSFSYRAPRRGFVRTYVHEEDAGIIKIEWNQTSVGNFQIIRETADKLKAEPALVSITEYDVVKNGIRFPSRDTTEESYLLKKNKKFVRSMTTIVYKDYKFFTVETDVRF